MSKYSSYIKRVDSIARAAIADLQKAEEAYNTARGRYDSSRGAGFTSAAEESMANAHLLEAKENYEKAKAACAGRRAEINTVRAELETAAKVAYAVDPAKLDAATMELLKSGILNSADYAKLAQDAGQAGNATMLRMIGKYAREAADASTDRDEESALRDVCIYCDSDESGPCLVAIDKIGALLDTCAISPGFIAEYDGLAAEAVAGL